MLRFSSVFCEEYGFQSLEVFPGDMIIIFLECGSIDLYSNALVPRGQKL